MVRPSSPLISRRGAAEAALCVIDDVGLAGLSLARVAARLGVRPPSLYHHFKDKAALLEEVTRLLLADLPLTDAAGQSFEERLVTLCVETRRSLLRHPNAVMLILHYFPRHLRLDAYDASLADNPYPPEFHLAVVEATEKMTFGSALFAAAAEARGTAAMPAIDAARLPRLARALAHNPFDDEALFIETIRTFLTGIAERCRRGTLGQPVATRAPRPAGALMLAD